MKKTKRHISNREVTPKVRIELNNVKKFVEKNNLFDKGDTNKIFTLVVRAINKLAPKDIPPVHIRDFVFDDSNTPHSVDILYCNRHPFWGEMSYKVLTIDLPTLEEG